MGPMVTEATEPMSPCEMSNPNLFFPGPSSCRPMTNVNQSAECETIPDEDIIQIEATLPSSIHEAEPNTTLGPDDKPLPKPEPALQPALELVSGPELAPAPELEIKLEPQQEPEPSIVVEPFCDKGEGVIKT